MATASSCLTPLNPFRLYGVPPWHNTKRANYGIIYMAITPMEILQHTLTGPGVVKN
jgi:hypothetical protein